MSRPTSKVAIPGAMIDRLREGPYSLTHEAALGSLGAHPLREATRRELHRDYKLWLETWVIPELERLLNPHERNARKAIDKMVGHAMTPDAYEPFRQAIRARGHKLTPYRLGYAIGFANSPLPCPYKSTMSADAFRAGLRSGALRRKVQP